MKKSLTIIAAILLTLTSSVYAQENGNKDANGKTVYGPYLTNKAADNWFIGVGAGAGMYLGGYNNSFAARIRPVFNFNFGKWFTPSIGARVSFDYSPMYREKIQGSWLKFQHYYVHGDFLWNISNTIGGYKETRLYEAVPFVGAGIGVNRRENFGSASCTFLTNAGIINKFRVSKRVNINLELIASVAPQSFDRHRWPNRTIDATFSALAGVTINLGKTGFKRASATAAVPVSDNSVNQEYDKFKKELEANKAELERVKAENEALKAKLAAVPATDAKQASKLTLYFKIGQATLEKCELNKLEGYMNGTEVSGTKNIEIVGEADKATGTTEFNQKLSEQRAEYVKNLLVEKYNVDQKAINAKGIGDTDNKEEKPSLNRKVTVTVK